MFLIEVVDTDGVVKMSCTEQAPNIRAWVHQTSSILDTYEVTYASPMIRSVQAPRPFDDYVIYTEEYSSRVINR